MEQQNLRCIIYCIHVLISIIFFRYSFLFWVCALHTSLRTSADLSGLPGSVYEKQHQDYTAISWILVHIANCKVFFFFPLQIRALLCDVQEILDQVQSIWKNSVEQKKELKCQKQQFWLKNTSQKSKNLHKIWLNYLSYDQSIIVQTGAVIRSHLFS